MLIYCINTQVSPTDAQGQIPGRYLRGYQIDFEISHLRRPLQPQYGLILTLSLQNFKPAIYNTHSKKKSKLQIPLLTSLKKIIINLECSFVFIRSLIRKQTNCYSELDLLLQTLFSSSCLCRLLFIDKDSLITPAVWCSKKTVLMVQYSI